MAEDTRSGEVPPSVSGADIRTFLFADMRGYTRFTQEHGDEAASAMASRFADLVREAVPEFEGELLELRGDEALCVFRSARQALRASIELQRRLRTVTEDARTFPLGVGMGLDAGEAIPTEGGYRGASLNLAARLCAGAKPGEILVSETVIGLAGRVGGLRFGARRSLRVKGVAEPVRAASVIPETPLPPVPLASHAGGRLFAGRRSLAIALGGVAIVVLVAGLTVAAVTRLETSPLLRLSGDSAGALDVGSPRLAVRSSVGSRPQAIAVGKGGVWVANAGDGTVSRLDASSGSVVDTIPVGGEPTGIAAGGSGVWVVDGATSRLLLISPSHTDPVVQQSRVGNGAAAVAVSGGSVWVANSFDGTVSRAAAASGKVVHTIALGASPSAIATGAGGVWVASQTAGVVVHLDSSGGIVARIPVGTSPAGIAVQRDAVWVADAQDGTLWRINPQTDTATPFAHVGGRPTAVAVFNEAVWVADQTGRLIAVDPKTGHIERVVTVGGAPGALSAGSGRLWVTSLPATSTHRGGALQVVEATCIVCVTNQLSSVDPGATLSLAELSVVVNVYDGLVDYRRVGGIAGARLVPDLAQSLPTVSDSGRTLTFHLRRGIRYSDGTPLRPEDFRRGIERTFELQNGLITTTGYYADLIGTSQCTTHPIACDLSRGITTNDRAGTIAFHLTRADPTFVYRLALTTADAVPPSAPALSRHQIVQRLGPVPSPARPKAFRHYLKRLAQLVDDGQHPFPGTGPYTIQHWDGKTVVLARNPRFHEWSADAQPAGYPDRIIVHTGAIPHMWQDYLNGGYDVLVDQTPGTRIDRLLRRTPDRVHPTVNGSLDYLILNNRKPPFSNVQVRRALNDATDRRQASSLWTGKAATVTCQIIPPNFPGYKPYCPYTRDPSPAGDYHGPNLAAAHTLISQAHAAGQTVHLVYGTAVTIKVINYFVTLLRHLGFHTDAHPFTWHGSVNGGVFGWTADWPSPSAFFDPLLSCGAPYNIGGYCNHRIDTQIHQAEQLDVTDPSASRALWQKIDREVTNQAPSVVINAARQYDLTSSRLGNYQFNPHYFTLLDQMWVK